MAAVHEINVMFRGEEDAEQKAQNIVTQLTRYKNGHDMHYHIDECEKIGLKITPLEEDDELQDLVLTVHHCYMHTLMNTPAFKAIENHKGVGIYKGKIQS